ncbi:hypothetical protein PHET_10505 [Paragonimus heterotremus]|uniref:Uncharacterized protein n=1 Tax=Paragonimus heterotremus TaxID=100268 RepID=A0A8J4SUC5_9TREM|nr:hypothetical protein PHET_10505 [Paragonimus heterotremus]
MKLSKSLTNWVRVFDGGDCKDRIIYFQTPKGSRTNVNLNSSGNQMLIMMELNKYSENARFVGRYSRIGSGEQSTPTEQNKAELSETGVQSVTSATNRHEGETLSFK